MIAARARLAPALAALLFLLVAPANARAAEPLRLDDAVQLALSRNERARIADEQITVADANVERARAGFLPTINVTGNDAAHPYDVERNGATVQPYNTTTGTITLTQPVVNVSAWPLYRQQERLLDAQKATSADAKRVLAFDAASAFMSALNTQEVLQAAQHRLDSARANLADTQARVAAGLNSSNDVTRASLDLASAMQEVANDTGAVQRADLALAFVVNAPVQGPLVSPAPTLQAAANPVASVDALVLVADARRLDLVAAKHASRAAHLFADEPMMRLIPTLNVQATASGTTLANAAGRNTDESMSALLSWPLYDAGVRYADKRSRGASASIADLQEQTLIRSIDHDVRAAAVSLQAAQAAMRASASAVEASRKSVDETATLYRQGLAKAIELTDANDARFLAEVSYAETELAMALAYLGLRQAMGLDPLGTELK